MRALPLSPFTPRLAKTAWSSKARSIAWRFGTAAAWFEAGNSGNTPTTVSLRKRSIWWPFSVTLSDPQLEAAANSGFYEINAGSAAASGVLEAPVELDMVWSDGHLEVTKRLKFGDDYIVEADVTVTKDGQPLPAGLAWRGGFGDPDRQACSGRDQSRLRPLLMVPSGSWPPLSTATAKMAVLQSMHCKDPS